jgi:cobaltochelatase CobN
LIAFLSTADTDILTLSHVARALPADFMPVRAANPATSDALSLVRQASTAVVLRVLGGRRTIEASFDAMRQSCVERGVPFIACAGDSLPDAELTSLCTAPLETVQCVFAYLCHGGAANLRNMLFFLAGQEAEPPAELPWFGVYDRSGRGPAPMVERPTPAIAVLFYRAHWMSGNTEFVDALCERLEALGCRAVPIFAYSLKPENAAQLEPLIREADPAAIVNTLSFASGSVDWLLKLDVPVLQAIISTSSEADWRRSQAGLSPIDAAMNVALPEFDGSIITVPISFKEQLAQDERLGSPVLRYVSEPERVDAFARLARNWAILRNEPNATKRVAFILSNYPTKNARIGNAVGLDTPASLLAALRAMRDAGYTVGDLPESGDELIFRLIDSCSYDREFLAEQQLAGATGHLPASDYGHWFETLPKVVQSEMREAWGDPPGDVFVVGEDVQHSEGRHPNSDPDGQYPHAKLAVPGLLLGNVFVGIQPPRGFGENPIAIYHSPDMPPTHHYLAYYHWIRDVFQAHAIVHVGKHGTLEWLPGKALGLSDACYPGVAIADLPHFYPFIINNPGEGAQAKRRSHAAIIDHLIPAMTTADAYSEIVRIEQLMDEYYQVQTLDPKKVPIIRDQIWDTIVEAQLHRDLGEPSLPADFDSFLLHVDGYLCELKDSQIRDGLHTLGQPPEGDHLLDLLLALTRLDNVEAPSLRAATARAYGLDYHSLLADRAAAYSGPQLEGVRTNGQAIEFIEARNKELVRSALNGESIEAPSQEVATVLDYVKTSLVPAIRQTTDEIASLLRGLEGRFIQPGPSGAPTRGMANVLPTGRNFYSVDPKTLPSPAAWEIGRQLGNALLDKYLAEEGRYPESVGIVVWGTSAMRTQGDDVAEILWLLGVRPVWMKENRRVSGLELIPLAELGRPRIDVTVRISGFFRDAFPNLVHLLDDAVRLVASLGEPDDRNLLAAHVRRDGATEEALYRVFGSKPGTYGAGILPLLDARNWRSDQDLADVYAAWGGYAYSRQEYGRMAKREFEQRFAEISIATKNQDNREHDIFDSDDYLQYHGGMIATIRALTGKNPRQFFGDSADPSLVRVRDLDDEARRVFRSRVVNPKWIESIKRHGYKGAFELAATVDYLFGYGATAQVVDDWMYERVTQTYVQDPDMQRFFASKNPWALRGIAERLLEAIERGMWKNPSQEQKEALQQAYLQMDSVLEARGE